MTIKTKMMLITVDSRIVQKYDTSKPKYAMIATPAGTKKKAMFLLKKLPTSSTSFIFTIPVINNKSIRNKPTILGGNLAPVIPTKNFPEYKQPKIISN